MDKIIFEKVGERLRQAREMNHITLEEAGKKVDVHKSTVLRWENGETEKIKLPIIELLSNYYNVNPAWLMGYDVPMKEINNKINSNTKIPLLGIVKAGYNYLAEENIIDYVSVTDSSLNNTDFFALRVKGDSMIPEIYENDIAIVKKQDDFENGDYVVALINGDEATIKKGYKTDSGLLLQPINQSVAPLIFDKETIKSMPVKIIGVVYNISRSFK